MSTIPSDDDSTTSSTNDPNLQTTNSPFIHLLTHVFLPVQLPDKNDNTPENSHSLARAVCAAAHAYGTHVCGTPEQAQWNRITKMLDNLQTCVRWGAWGHMVNDCIISQLRGMETGGTLTGSPQILGADNL
jgi:hypothetical protein